MAGQMLKTSELWGSPASSNSFMVTREHVFRN